MENKIEDQTSVQPDQELEPETEQLDTEPETQQFGEEAETKMVDQEPETKVTPQAQESCTSCGAPMAADQAFCTSCGAAKSAPAKRVCSKCGAELSEGQDFCPKCGQKVGLEIDAGVADAISQFNSGVSAANEAKKKQPQKIIIAVIAAIVVIAAAIFAIPKLFPSVESLCEQGRYVEAYEKADGDEAKLAVKIESAAAQAITMSTEQVNSQSESSPEYLFNVRSAYLNCETDTDGEIDCFLAIQAEIFVNANSIGDGYILYKWNADNNKFSCWGIVYNLDFDDADDKKGDSDEVILRLLTKRIYRETVEGGTALSDEGVARVNTVITNGVTIDPGHYLH